jgi:hypothetical protein
MAAALFIAVMCFPLLRGARAYGTSKMPDDLADVEMLR